MNNNIEVNRVILNTLLSTFGLLALLYVLIMGNMVVNIVERKALEKEVLTTSNEVGQLELSYLSVSGSVDMALSSSMGFKETKATFATRKSLGSLKLANNEI
ncbi:hypothetical protein HY311_02465 [Candidatus Nomurabacteria bacterium]|nr:hypothetical protein [Candidatus Nomurabacteria bacterium]